MNGTCFNDKELQIIAQLAYVTFDSNMIGYTLKEIFSGDVKCNDDSNSYDYLLKQFEKTRKLSEDSTGANLSRCLA